MNTANQVITDLGGVQKTAALLGVSAQAICNMRTRGRFPPKHWPVLVREGQARGKSHITFDFLEKLGPEVPAAPEHAEPPHRSAA
ncbi:MAG TPA: hypothetical protein VG897_13100 [Terriglobales bacterium]|nr:hypothetical protein [Terriglobales bacterium]